MTGIRAPRRSADTSRSACPMGYAVSKNLAAYLNHPMRQLVRAPPLYLARYGQKIDGRDGADGLRAYPREYQALEARDGGFDMLRLSNRSDLDFHPFARDRFKRSSGGFFEGVLSHRDFPSDFVSHGSCIFQPHHGILAQGAPIFFPLHHDAHSPELFSRRHDFDREPRSVLCLVSLSPGLKSPDPGIRQHSHRLHGHRKS